MTAFAYADASVPVPDALRSAHAAEWARIAGPGTWWDGRERLAVADEVRRARDCALCRERRASGLPRAVEGTHDSGGVLPEAAVDVVHRVVTDASRLTPDWYREKLAGGLTPEQYVEIIGIVVNVVSIDAFDTALGVPLEPLPAPRDGEPTRERPDGLVEGVAWVPVASRAVGNVIRALSLVPDELRAWRALAQHHYVPDSEVVRVNRGKDVLSRSQIELIAGRVSALNECFY